MRTLERLNAAVVQLASTVPVETVSVSDLCQVAGIGRSTFYRHATSPAEVLQYYIAADLRTQRDEFVRATVTGTELEALHRRLILGLAEHLERHAAMYELSLSQPQSATATALGDHLYASVLDYVRLRGDTITLLRDADPVDRGFVEQALAHNFAGGQLGLIRAWIDSRPRHREVLEALMLALSPGWDKELMQI